MFKQKIKYFWQEARPHQWIKNLLLFVPLIFAQKLFKDGLLWHTILSFIAFSLTASSVYVLNDLIDLRYDKLHPHKSGRPLAAGKIKISEAKILFIILLILGLTLSLLISRKLFFILIFYFLLNLIYSSYFKKLVIIDLIAVAVMYLIRLYAGAVVINVSISSWLLLTALMGAFFIVTGRRRSEILLNNSDDLKTRGILTQYSVIFLDYLIIMSSMASLIFYALYSMTHGSLFIWSILFVVYVLFRYLWLIFVKGQGEEPEKLIIQDKPIFYTLILWMIFIVLALY